MVAKRNDGKDAEHYIQEALKALEQRRKATWVRLYDSTSAGFSGGGNLIPAQPGDFIYTVEGKGSLLEVKSSVVHEDLQLAPLRDVFSENQILGARLWIRAGNRALCAFHPVGSGRIDIWDMSLVIPAWLAPPRQRKLLGKPIASSHCTKQALADTLYLVLS